MDIDYFQIILLKFTNVDIEPPDSLEVIDVKDTGSLTPTGGITEQTSLYVHHNISFISFISDDSIGKNGFQFSFEFVGKYWMMKLVVCNSRT